MLLRSRGLLLFALAGGTALGIAGGIYLESGRNAHVSPQPAAANAVSSPRSERTPPAIEPARGPGRSRILTGILNFSQSPLNHTGKAVVNQWQGVRGSTIIDVYAGCIADPGADDYTCERDRTSQGFVAEYRWSRSGGTPGATFFLTPARVGALKVSAAKGFRLSLTSAAGHEFTFDVLHRVLRPVV
jgi:hypothetical protein